MSVTATTLVAPAVCIQSCTRRYGKLISVCLSARAVCNVGLDCDHTVIIGTRKVIPLISMIA